MHTIFSISQIGLTFLGLYHTIPNGNLTCDGDSGKWKVMTKYGDVFITLHILVLIFHTAAVVATYYKIPKRHGFFSGQSSGNLELGSAKEGYKPSNNIQWN